MDLQNRFYIMRHGESTANREGIIVSQPERGIASYGLTTLGVQQVSESAVKTRINHTIQIVSSDFLRARETAEVFHRVVDAQAPIVYRAELRERYFGEWELHDAKQYQTVWNADENPALNGGFGVESVYQVLERVLSLLTELDQKSKNMTYLLVAHGDVLQILLCHFHGLDVRWHRHMPMIKNAEIRSLKPGSFVRNIA